MEQLALQNNKELSNLNSKFITLQEEIHNISREVSIERVRRDSNSGIENTPI
jgi:hypothetical protein